MSVARHTVYNFFGAIVPLAVSLVTVPLYLRAIGLDRFGILSICWLLVGYFNLFDFGLSRATAQKIAVLGHAPAAERSRIFWTSALLSAVLSSLAVLVFFSLLDTGLAALKLGSAGLRQESRNASPFLVAAVPFGIAQSLLTGALEGRREFLKINLIVSAGTIATAIFPLAAATWIDVRLPYLVGATLISRTLVLLMLIIVCAGAVPLHRPQFASSAEIRRLLQFGGWTTISSIIGPLLVFIDRFAIATLIGAAAVALYVVPYNLVSQLVLFPAALAGALFPRMASLSPDEARTMSRDGLQALVFLLTPATLLMLALVGPFLELWIGNASALVSTPVALILLVGFWANSLARLPYARLLAGGRPRLIASLHLAEILPYLGLLYFGIAQFGLVGAALAWSVRCTADALLLVLIDRVDKSTLRLLALHGAIVLATFAVLFLVPTTAASRWMMLAAVFAFLVAVLAFTIPPQFPGFHRRLKLKSGLGPGATP